MKSTRKLDYADLVDIVRLSREENLGAKAIAKIYGVGRSPIRRFLAKDTYKDFWEEFEKEGNGKPIAHGETAPPESKRLKLEGSRFVITSAQNNTHAHKKFLKSLHTYCAENDATLLVSTFHYNKSGFQNGESDSLWFDPEVRDYIIDEPVQLAEGLVFCGELNILPTAVNPLSGFQSYTGAESGIIPHTKMQMESVATPKSDEPKFLYTTGAVTQRNYIQMKAGQKAEFNHIFGAVIVEIDGDGDWFVRQINADSTTGEFYDLDKYYTPEKVYESTGIEAINYGDIHVAKLDEEVAEVSWRGVGSILDTLTPKYQFIHDVLDQRARNHHNVSDPHFLYEMFIHGTESVKDEVEQTVEEILQMTRPWVETVIVESNHDLALQKWLKEQDYRRDPVNAMFFLELQLEKYRAIQRKEKDWSCFEAACKMVDKTIGGDCGVTFLKTDESFRICESIECGQHGHNGANGSRGSLQAFIKQGIKFNVGHTHCLTEDHFVNVQGKGWTRISNVHVGDYVTGMEDGQITYTLVEDTIEGVYSGYLYTIGGNLFKQTVTDQHNLYLNDGSYINVKDAILTRRSSEVPLSGDSMSEVDEYPITDNEIRQLVAFCADGHLDRTHGYKRFHIKKQRKIDRLKELFGDDLSGFSLQSGGAYKCKIKSGTKSFTFLDQVFAEQSKKKSLPDFLIQLNNRQADLFLEELTYWDGTFKKETDKGGNQFNTTKESETNIVSTLAHRLGYRVTCKRKGGTDIQRRVWHISWCNSDYFNREKRDLVDTKSRIETWKPIIKKVENEPVFCLTTGTSNFWVRHETSGKVSLTGNSAAIRDGVYYAGVSGSMDMGYNVGGSSWSHSHIITYHNGKRAILTLKNGKWRA